MSSFGVGVDEKGRIGYYLHTMAEVKKREGESTNSLIFRFIKRVKQTGVLFESKKRRFRSRPQNRLKRKLSALHREVRKKEMETARKMGLGKDY